MNHATRTLDLFVGKQMGVFGFAWRATRAGLRRLPEGVTWTQIYGAVLVAGIGFTMSLFVGTLALPDPSHATTAGTRRPARTAA